MRKKKTESRRRSLREMRGAKPVIMAGERAISAPQGYALSGLPVNRYWLLGRKAEAKERRSMAADLVNRRPKGAAPFFNSESILLRVEF
jgi:hypothetical protein